MPGEAFAPPLSHDPKCGVCRHPHHLLTCEHDGSCQCAFPPLPGIYVNSEPVSPT